MPCCCADSLILRSSFAIQCPRGFHVDVALPARSTLGGGARGRAIEMLQGNLCSVLLRIVDMLSIVPKSGRDILSLHSDSARPCCSSASSIRHDLENWRMYLSFAALLFESLLPCSSTRVRRIRHYYDALENDRQGLQVASV